jgi:mannuronan 5-epimerase
MVNRKYTLLSSTFGTIVVVVFLLLSALLSTLLVDSSSSSSAQVTESTSSCMLYNSAEKIITITCKSANLTDIDNQLKDPGILHKETAADDTGIWLLNAGVEVAQYATLYINSTDTTWLKIVADGKEAAHIIHILGS